MSVTKKRAPKLIFFNEKKIEKDSDDFWIRKLTLKVKFWHIHSMSILRQNLFNFVPPLENSTILNTIIYSRVSLLTACINQFFKPMTEALKNQFCDFYLPLVFFSYF